MLEKNNSVMGEVLREVPLIEMSGRWTSCELSTQQRTKTVRFLLPAEADLQATIQLDMASLSHMVSSSYQARKFGRVNEAGSESGQNPLGLGGISGVR